MTLEQLKSYNTSNLINEGNFKIGYRKSFLDTPITLGRQRVIILPNQEVHKSVFAIVELADIIASNNEKTFSNSKGYPLTADNRTIQDRNYLTDKQAQAKVKAVAQKLQPNLVISTGADADGTPIITLDGIVVSGNNRAMSLKLAKSDFPEKYKEYVDTLKKEISYGGYGDEITKGLEFKNPILVRFDLDFQSYITEEMNQYNVESKKSERPIDQMIRISQQLEDNEQCKTELISLVSEQETVSELYNTGNDVIRLRKILLKCNLINENQIAKYFLENTLTEDGKMLYQTILSGLVLNPTTLEISQRNGVKKATKSIVNAIIPTIKNNELKKGSLNASINKSILLQNKMASSGIMETEKYVSQTAMFDKPEEYLTEESIIINWYLNQKANDFKKALISYNDSMKLNQGVDIFNEQLAPEEIFEKTFTKFIPEQLKTVILNRFKAPLEEKPTDVTMAAVDKHTGTIAERILEHETHLKNPNLTDKLRELFTRKIAVWKKQLGETPAKKPAPTNKSSIQDRIDGLIISLEVSSQKFKKAIQDRIDGLEIAIETM